MQLTFRQALGLSQLHSSCTWCFAAALDSCCGSAALHERVGKGFDTIPVPAKPAKKTPMQYHFLIPEMSRFVPFLTRTCAIPLYVPLKINLISKDLSINYGILGTGSSSGVTKSVLTHMMPYSIFVLYPMNSLPFLFSEYCFIVFSSCQVKFWKNSFLHCFSNI